MEELFEFTGPALLVVTVFCRLEIRERIIPPFIGYKHQSEQAKMEAESDGLSDVYISRACAHNDADSRESTRSING